MGIRLKDRVETGAVLPSHLYRPNAGIKIDSLRPAHHAFMASQSDIGFFAIDNLLLVASPGVYHPGPGSSTIFMLKHLPVFDNCSILEIGTGTGAIGIHYAKRDNNVTLSDIDPAAARCASFNVLINHVEARVLISDVYSAIGSDERFDVVLFNVPFFQKPIEYAHEVMACDPDGGVLCRFLAGLPSKLASEGVAYITYSNLADLDLLNDQCSKIGLVHESVATEVDEATGVSRHLIEIKAQ